MEFDAAHTRGIKAAAHLVDSMGLSGIDIAKPDNAVGVVFNGLHHTIIQLGSEHTVQDGKAGSLDVKAIHRPQQIVHGIVGSAAAFAHVDMEIINHFNTPPVFC